MGNYADIFQHGHGSITVKCNEEETEWCSLKQSPELSHYHAMREKGGYIMSPIKNMHVKCCQEYRKDVCLTLPMGFGRRLGN